MALWLVRNGVPYRTAMQMEEHELLAHAITFSGFESGKKWDWTTMKFRDR
jgi:hypothetical protein